MSKDDLLMRSGLGRSMSYAEVDGNFNRLMYLTGNWVAGSYTPNEIVRHDGALWVCLIATSLEPSMEETVATGNWFPLVYPGSGSGTQDVSQVIGTVGAGWTTIEMDNEGIPPYGCSFDLAADTFQFLFPGVWQLNGNLFFSHDSSNNGRTTNLRFFNVTDGVPIGTPVPIGIARNVEDSQASFTVLLRLAASDADETIRVEIGGGDTLSAVTISAFAMNLIQVSP